MPQDKNGNPLAVGDHVKISGTVASIVDANSVTILSSEINYPTSTTVGATITANGRIAVKD